MGESFDPQVRAEFDRYARGYHEMHAASIAASGEDPEYFAQYKRHFVERLLGARFDAPVLDFGCGIGNLTRFLVEAFPTVHGYDPSSESVRMAAGRVPGATFFHDEGEIARGRYGAVVVANVLHHVPSSNRESLLRIVVDSLVPGGRLIVFEHNPLNPLTRRAVAACPFDEDAELLYPWQLTRLLRRAGLRDVRREFIVFFPHFLSVMRRLEPRLAWLPLGAQVVCWGARS